MSPRPRSAALLTDCRIETEGELDLRGFLGLDEEVSPGYRRISYTVHLEGDGTREQFEEIHQAVMATSPNYFTWRSRSRCAAGSPDLFQGPRSA